MSNYEYKTSSGEVVNPKKITRTIAFTVETDYHIEIDSDLPEDEIVGNFLAGKYDDMPTTEIASRLSKNGIRIEENHVW